MQQSLDKYKQQYYERVPLTEQVDLITEPSLKSLNYLQIQNAKRIYNYTITQYNQILLSPLKKTVYKSRINKLFKIIDQIKRCFIAAEFETNSFFEHCEKALDKINDYYTSGSQVAMFETFDENFRENVVPIIQANDVTLMHMKKNNE